MRVTKSSGITQEYNEDKIKSVVEWATVGTSINPESIMRELENYLFDLISTQQIQDKLVKISADKISDVEPDYQYVASRLRMFGLRKQVYGCYQPISFYSHINSCVKNKVYDKEILEKWSEEEIKELGQYVDHERDMDISYAGAMQLIEKYLVKDRSSGKIFETPQFAYMLIGMCLHQEEPEYKRMKHVIEFYDTISKKKASLPTPIMSGVRTPTRQFSSCVLIDSGDDLDSINAASNSIVKYISKRAGIGVNGGRIRAEGSRIRSGEVRHTGVIPFWKHFQTAVKSCSQGGVRGGAATLFYPIWHLETEKLLVLKNNRGIEENRIRQLDYGVQFNNLMYERLVNGDYITLFSPDVMDGELYESFFSDSDRFKELYEQLEADPNIRKKRVKAIDLFSTFMLERSSTARNYIMNVDNVNQNSPFDETIYQSNLCVAPETQILTKSGYVPIAELEDQIVDVWNGKEFTQTTVRKTGTDQKLIKVTTNSGQTIECTPYHKFYVVDETASRVKYKEVRGHELTSGMKLIKFDLPTIEGDKELDKAYINGFYSGDGCLVGNNQQRVYLYNEKRELQNLFGHNGWYVQEEYNRQHKHFTDLKDKFFVPTNEYSIKSRLEWLAGYLDADGCVYRNGDNNQLVATSIEYNFLKETQLMLQTLGVDSKIKTQNESGYHKLPKNDGTGEYGDFWCNKIYRLIITSNGLYKLLSLGLKLHRLEVSYRLPQRDAKRFIKIDSVVDDGRFDDTFCFTESKRGMGMFNGILTGQCLEIALPTKPIFQDSGEIALCTLAAFNLGEIEYEEIPVVAKVLVRALDNLLDYQDYPMKQAERAKYRRSLGIGIINFAYFLAKNYTRYSDEDAKELTHQWAEKIQYSLLEASNLLAEEKGACGDYGLTTYAHGVLPIDRYNKNMDDVVESVYRCDWEGLRQRIKEHGLRNSTLSALMPSESSSQVHNATNGIDPPRGRVSVKSSKDGVFNQVVPEVELLGDEYEYLWEMARNGNKGYLEICGVWQKFIDQTISANTSYDPSMFENNKVPMSILLRDMLYANHIGLKTLYYHNTRDGADGSEETEETEIVGESDCAGGGCKI